MRRIWLVLTAAVIMAAMGLLIAQVVFLAGLALAQGQSATAPHGGKGTGDALLKLKGVEGGTQPRK